METKSLFRQRLIGKLKGWATHFSLCSAGTMGFLLLRFPFNFTRIIGKKNVPQQGRNVLFVSNHQSMYDSVLIAICAYYPEVLVFPSYPPYNFAAEENFFNTWYVRILFRFLRTVPVKRGRRDPMLMRRYVNFLEQNNILIFYQGGRSHDLKRIKSGAAFVIAESKQHPIVIPVYHEGMERIFRRGGPGTKSFWRWIPLGIFRRPIIVFGAPTDFSDLRQISDKRQRINAINSRIIEQVEELKGLTERFKTK